MKKNLVDWVAEEDYPFVDETKNPDSVQVTGPDSDGEYRVTTRTCGQRHPAIFIKRADMEDLARQILKQVGESE